MSDYELSQYCARGNASHAMFDNWKINRTWDEKVIKTRDMALLKQGSLKLVNTLPQINFLGFMEKHGKGMVFGPSFRGYNCKHSFTGEVDSLGTYIGKKAIYDVKTRGGKDHDFMQKGGYSLMDHPRFKGVKYLITIPLNTKNKAGFGAPRITDKVKHWQSEFLDYRKVFKERFGV